VVKLLEMEEMAVLRDHTSMLRSKAMRAGRGS
jgi:hypothetical protein